MSFEVTKEFIKELQELITDGKDNTLLQLLDDLHPADITEIFDELSFDQNLYLIKILDNDKASDVLAELDEEDGDRIIKELSTKEIAENLNKLDSDDATDIIADLPEKQKEEVIAQIENVKHVKDIVDLLQYDEDTAGGLMGKELVKVNENWTNIQCVKEMRRQAEGVKKVHTIYVVDDHDVLKGRLPLKNLLTSPASTPIKEIYNPKIIAIKASEKGEDVANTMQKYDLFVAPIVDEIGRLVGQITIDDIVDLIRDEAEKDYQMAAGITEGVDAEATIFQLTKARLPWWV